MSGTSKPPRGVNAINNPIMSGAVAGTPGTLPTGWSATLLGCSQQVVGTGTVPEGAYIDIRIFGTPSSSNQLPLVFQGASVIAAVPGQVFTEILSLGIVAGDFTNVSTVALRINWQGAGSNSDGADIKGSLSATLQRFALTAIAPAATTFAMPRLIFGVTIGLAVDFTVRIVVPRLVRGVPGRERRRGAGTH